MQAPAVSGDDVAVNPPNPSDPTTAPGGLHAAGVAAGANAERHGN
jgi:hypothetical protein